MQEYNRISQFARISSDDEINNFITDQLTGMQQSPDLNYLKSVHKGDVVAYLFTLLKKRLAERVTLERWQSEQDWRNIERLEQPQVAGRQALTRHDLILKLVTELTQKFRTHTKWLPIIEQIKTKPSLIPLKAMYPANMRKKAARDLKLLDDQLRQTPLLIYLSLIDRVGHADFEHALSATQKRARDHF